MAEFALNITGRATRVVLFETVECPELYRQASVIYDAIRDASGEGASTFPEGRISSGHKCIARLSYNGKVWEPKPYPDAKLLWPEQE